MAVALNTSPPVEAPPQVNGWGRGERSIDGGRQPPQVCLDGRLLGRRAGTGIATYAEVLARCLAPAGVAPALLEDDRPDGGRARIARWGAALDRRPRCLSRRPAEPGGPWEGWRARDLFGLAHVFFSLHGRLMPLTCPEPPAVMHWTYPAPLYLLGARNLYTVHDLIPLTDPALTGIRPRRHRRLLGRIVEHAQALVTVSETVRRTLIAELDCDPAFVVNTYQGVLAAPPRQALLPAGLAAGRYLLVCGAVERRKNIAALIAAHVQAGAPLPLVVVGPALPGEEELEALIARTPQVVRLPWQPRPVLLALLQSARALLFVSLAEGFGLPIAEAMSLDVPVLASATGAPAEIAGEAALLADPGDVPALARAIRALATDDRLCARLRAAGRERAALFAPEAYQRRLRALYDRVLAMPPRQPEGAR